MPTPSRKGLIKGFYGIMNNHYPLIRPSKWASFLVKVALGGGVPLDSHSIWWFSSSGWCISMPWVDLLYMYTIKIVVLPSSTPYFVYLFIDSLGMIIFHGNLHETTSVSQQDEVHFLIIRSQRQSDESPVDFWFDFWRTEQQWRFLLEGSYLEICVPVSNSMNQNEVQC